MKRYNPAVNRMKEAREAKEARTHTAVQMSFDVACLAAHDVFGMGPGRFLAFMEAFKKRYVDVASLIREDAKDDAGIEYARATVDKALKEIAGEENFQPWEERYRF